MNETREKWANPDAVGFLLCGFYLFLSAPSLMGLVGQEAGLAALPIGLMILLGLCFVVAACYRNGDVFGVTMNTMLGIVLIGSVNLAGIQSLMMQALHWEKTASWLEISKIVDGMSFLIFGLVLFVGAVVIARRLRFLALSFTAAGLGMLLMALSLLGVLPMRVFPWGGGLVSQLSLALLYAGAALLLQECLGRSILPLGSAMFTEKTEKKKDSDLYMRNLEEE